MSAATRHPIFLARHGDRIDFVNPGWGKTAKAPDDPWLAERGHKQATELAERLKTEVNGPFVIISSPFQRAVATANYSAETLDSAILIEHGICEILDRFPPNYRTVQDLATEFPRIDMSYKPHSIPNSEEYCDNDCFKRVAPICAYFENLAKEKTVIAFAHGAPLTGLLKKWTGRVTYPGLCTLTKLVYDERQKCYRPEYTWSADHLSDKTNLRAW